MYMTQGSFFGKTGPIDRSLSNKNANIQERFYPNKWQEERNLRTMHNKLTAKSLFNSKINNNDRPENDKVNVVNQKYLAVSYKPVPLI